MDISRFFIDRPIFAAVLSIVIFVAGAIAIPLLPISEYLVPPTVVVQATYPGANPKVIADTVSSPLEEQINGVENMMYMKSVAGSAVIHTLFRQGRGPRARRDPLSLRRPTRRPVPRISPWRRRGDAAASRAAWPISSASD